MSVSVASLQIVNGTIILLLRRLSSVTSRMLVTSAAAGCAAVALRCLCRCPLALSTRQSREKSALGRADLVRLCYTQVLPPALVGQFSPLKRRVPARGLSLWLRLRSLRPGSSRSRHRRLAKALRRGEVKG